jgi:hypothetical protein
MSANRVDFNDHAAEEDGALTEPELILGVGGQPGGRWRGDPRPWSTPQRRYGDGGHPDAPQGFGKSSKDRQRMLQDGENSSFVERRPLGVT